MPTGFRESTSDTHLDILGKLEIVFGLESVVSS